MNGENQFNQWHFVHILNVNWILFSEIIFLYESVKHNENKAEERKKGMKSINFAWENRMEIKTTARYYLYFVATNITHSFSYVNKFFDFQ